MVNRFIGFFSLLSAVVLILMMTLTTPSGVGPVGVLVFFTTLYIALFGISTLVVGILNKMLGKKSMKFKDYLYAALVTFGPIFLILLKSFGTLNLLTLLMAVTAVGIACFIVNKRL